MKRKSLDNVSSPDSEASPMRYRLCVIVLGLIAISCGSSSYTRDQLQVRNALKSASSVQVLDVYGDFDDLVSVRLRLPGQEVMVIGAIGEKDFLDKEHTYVESIGKISVWRVECSGPEGFPMEYGLQAIPGARVNVGTFIGNQIHPPIRSPRDAIVRSKQIQDVLSRLPACDTWNDASTKTPVCQAPVDYGWKEFKRIRLYACTESILDRSGADPKDRKK